MAEHYSELEVAHTERVQSSPEAVDYSTFAPQRVSLSNDSPEVVSQPTFTSDAAHNSLLSDGDGTDTKKWNPQVRLLARTIATVTHNCAGFSSTRSLRLPQSWFEEEGQRSRARDGAICGQRDISRRWFGTKTIGQSKTSGHIILGRGWACCFGRGGHRCRRWCWSRNKKQKFQ